MTSRADITPTIPSYLPPAGCVSGCELFQLRVDGATHLALITEMATHSDRWYAIVRSRTCGKYVSDLIYL